MKPMPKKHAPSKTTGSAAKAPIAKASPTSKPARSSFWDEDDEAEGDGKLVDITDTVTEGLKKTEIKLPHVPDVDSSDKPHTSQGAAIKQWPAPPADYFNVNRNGVRQTVVAVLDREGRELLCYDWSLGTNVHIRAADLRPMEAVTSVVHYLLTHSR